MVTLQTPRATYPAIAISDADGVRYLHLGDTPWVQGAMRLRDPNFPYLQYVQRMFGWMLFMPQAVLHSGVVVQLGLGAASCTKFSALILGLKTLVIEVNAQVIEACHQYFGLPRQHPNLDIQLADAGKQVKSAEYGGRVDVLQVDLYDHQAAAPLLDTSAFYRDCRSTLSVRGCMVINLFGRKLSYADSLHRIVTVFGQGHVWECCPTTEGNTIVLAFKNPVSASPGQMHERAQKIEAQYGLATARWPSIFQPVNV